jgi:hypothetical protein
LLVYHLILDAVAHLVITAHLGIYFGGKMQIEKLKKTCGLILYIKSIIQLVVTIILFFGGIFLIVEGQKAKNNTNPSSGLDNQIAACSSAFASVLVTAIGIISLIVAIVLGICAIVYLIHSRKILYLNDYQKKSTITLLVFEILYIFVSTIGLIISIIHIQDTVLWLIVSLIVFIQSLVTTILLVKYVRTNQIKI